MVTPSCLVRGVAPRTLSRCSGNRSPRREGCVLYWWGVESIFFDSFFSAVEQEFLRARSPIHGARKMTHIHPRMSSKAYFVRSAEKCKRRTMDGWKDQAYCGRKVTSGAAFCSHLGSLVRVTRLFLAVLRLSCCFSFAI